MKTKKSLKSRRQKPWHIVIIVTVALLIAAGIYLFILKQTENSQTETKDVEPQQYTVKEVDSGESIDISGNIEPALSADLTFGRSGVVEAIYVEEGQTVRKGQLLAKLEDVEILYDLKSLEYDINEAQVTGSQKTLTLLKLKQQVLEADLQDTQLIALINGTVSEINIDEGDNVAAGTAQNAFTAIRIINTDRLTATIEIDEIDVPNISIGQQAQLVFDALPDLQVSGVINSLSLEARVTDQGIAVVDAEILVEKPSPEIRPYFSFTGEILMDDLRTELIIEKEAIIERNGNFMALRYDEQTNRPEPSPVSVKEYDSKYYQIISGLQAGDIVMAAPSLGPGRSANGSEKNNSPMDLLGLPTPGNRNTRGGSPGGQPSGDRSGGPPQ